MQFVPSDDFLPNKQDLTFFNGQNYFLILRDNLVYQ